MKTWAKQVYVSLQSVVLIKESFVYGAYLLVKRDDIKETIAFLKSMR